MQAINTTNWKWRKSQKNGFQKIPKQKLILHQSPWKPREKRRGDIRHIKSQASEKPGIGYAKKYA